VATPGSAVGVGAGVGGQVLAVGGDVVGAAGGLDQGLDAIDSAFRP
jgi:hypothetical protein